MRTKQRGIRAWLAVTGRVAAFAGIFIALYAGLDVPVKWLNSHLSLFGFPPAASSLARRIVQEATLAVCGLLPFVFVIRRLEKLTLAQAGFAPIHIGRDLAAGFVLGLLIVGAIVASLWSVGQYRILGRSPHFYPLLVLGLALCIGVFEETVFRGLLFGVIERRAGTGWALGISSALFGLSHITDPDGNPLSYGWIRALAVAVGISLVLSGLYLVTRRLWMPIALHAGWDFLALTLSNGLDLPNVSAYITRDDPTPIHYLLDALICAVVGIVLIRAAIRRGEWKTVKRPSAFTA